MIKISVLGKNGRMGKTVQHLLETEFKQKAAYTAEVLKSEVVVDFSAPAAVIELINQMGHLDPAIKAPALIIGSTGWSDSEMNELSTIAVRTAVLKASNFSIGFSIFLENLKTAGASLGAHGYTARISETHHIHKKDSPSGTAILIQSALARHFPNGIPIDSFREGEVIGEHEIQFESLGDRIIFKHSAKDRSVFARGAIEAAIWLATQNRSGRILGLQDFLSLNLVAEGLKASDIKR